MVNKKNILRIVILTALILLIPFIAMQFSSEMKWDLADFNTAGALLLGAGLIYELLVSKISNEQRKRAFTIGLVVALLMTWAQLAVGIFD